MSLCLDFLNMKLYSSQVELRLVCDPQPQQRPHVILHNWCFWVLINQRGHHQFPVFFFVSGSWQVGQDSSQLLLPAPPPPQKDPHIAPHIAPRDNIKVSAAEPSALSCVEIYLSVCVVGGGEGGGGRRCWSSSVANKSLQLSGGLTG